MNTSLFLVGGRGVGVEEEVVDFNVFWDREEGGVPLVYDVTNEKINCNRKQAKEMTRKKEKHKNDKVCKPRGIYYPNITDT